MKPILLYADDRRSDREAARLLELELQERDLTVTFDLTEQNLGAAVFLASRPSESAVAAIEKLLRRSPLPVLCCYHDTDEPLPTGVILVERPFDVCRLCESLVLAAADKPLETPSPPASELILEPATHSVLFASERIPLSRREFALLHYLHAHRDRPVSREEARTAVWQSTPDTATNVVDVYIRYLRQKLDERFDTRMIRTVRGQGYQLML